MFGLFDLVTIQPGEIVGIQSTGHTNRSKHIAAMMENENLGPWIEAGGKVEIWTWKKGMVGKQVRWACRKEQIAFRTNNT